MPLQRYKKSTRDSNWMVHIGFWRHKSYVEKHRSFINCW